MRKIFPLLFALISWNALSAQVPSWQAPVLADDTWRYLEPTSQPSSTWKQVGFNDASWPIGQGGFGYADGDDNTVVAAQISIYLRIEFDVVDASAISDALFYMDYDDGYVAYLNETEIGRSATMNGAGSDPPYTEATDGEHEAQMYQGGDPEEVEVDATLFQNGTNCLAIQVHNWSANSSDMSALPFLFTRITDGSTNFSNPPTWFVPPIEEFDSNLPLILIDTDGQTILDNDMITADMAIINNGPGQLNSTDDPPTDFNGRIGIEIRGSSSQMFPKKQYEVETQDLGGAAWDVSLIGMPEESDWILYAPYSDKSMIRNVLTYDLSNKMGQYAPRSQFCEVFLNEQYIGVYLLMEKVKWGNDRVDIVRIDETDLSGDDVTGGYLLKVDKETGSGVDADWWSNVTFFQVPREYGFQYERPLRTVIAGQQENYIQAHVNAMEGNMGGPMPEDPASGYRHYFDLPALVDYTLMSEFTKDVDAYRLSTFFSKQRDSRGGKLIMGPIWDLNIAYGNADYCDGADTDGWAYTNCERHEIPFWWDVFFEDAEFQQLMACRWQELRQSVLHEDSINDQIDAYLAHLDIATDRNFVRWPILGTYVWPNAFIGNTHAEEVQYLKDYISGRLTWLDANLPSVAGSCGSVHGSSLLVSEISYNQGNGDDTDDWFELYNSSAASIDLSFITVKDQSNYNSFTFPGGTEILPDSFLVIARDLDAFSAVHPSVQNVVQGSFNWGLGSTGDDIRVWDVDGLPIAHLTYGTMAPWPSTPNGQGPSLEFDLAQTDQSDGSNWFEGCEGGSPGMRYVDCSSSIREQSEFTFSLVPTVGSGDFNLRLISRSSQTISAEILDLQGKQVCSVIQPTNYSSGLHTINFNSQELGLASGFFLLRVSSQEHGAVAKRFAVIE